MRKGMMMMVVAAMLGAAGTAETAEAQFGPTYTYQGRGSLGSFFRAYIDVGLSDAVFTSYAVRVFATFTPENPGALGYSTSFLNPEPNASGGWGCFFSDRHPASTGCEAYWGSLVMGPYVPPDSGWIIAVYDFDQESEHPGIVEIVTLHRTPEPGTYALLGTGLLGIAGVGVVRRRREG